VSKLHTRGRCVCARFRSFWADPLVRLACPSVTNHLALLPTEVDCWPVLPYACDMRPSRELGLKDFPTPHALTLPRLLLVTSWALFGALTWDAFQKPWGRIGYGVFNLLGIISGFLITRAVLVGRLRVFFPLPLCRRRRCHTLGRDYVWRLGTLFGYERKATICTNALVETCTSVRERDLWSFYRTTPGGRTKGLLVFANGQTTQPD
jgi:hypothetical protein